MTTMSKILLPSFSDLIMFRSYALIVYAFFVLKQNTECWRQAITKTPLDVLDGDVSCTERNDGSVSSLNQEKYSVLVSKNRFNLIQRITSDSKEKILKEWFMTYGSWFIMIIAKRIKQLYAETRYRTSMVLLNKLRKEVWEYVSVCNILHFMCNFDTVAYVKYMRDFESNEKPSILDLLLLQESPKSKSYREYLEESCEHSKDLMCILTSHPSNLQLSPEMERFIMEWEDFCKSPKQQRISNNFSSMFQMDIESFFDDREYFCKFFAEPWIVNNLPYLPQVWRICNKSLENSSIRLDKNEIAKEGEDINKHFEETKKSSHLFPQTRPETTELAMECEDCCKSAEKQVSTTSVDNAESQNLKPFQQKDGMKNLRMCDLCLEFVSEKKFFDERRFGILSKCDCKFCYGCMRKVTSTPTGVVKGPVKCPLCCEKSDIVALSVCWIEGKEKVKFFETYRKNTEFINVSMKLGWTGFHARKNNFFTKGQNMVLVN